MTIGDDEERNHLISLLPPVTPRILTSNNPPTDAQQLAVLQTEEQVFRNMIQNSIVSLNECDERTAALSGTAMDKNKVNVDTNDSVMSSATLHPRGNLDSNNTATADTVASRRRLQATTEGMARSTTARRPKLTSMGLMNHLNSYLALPSTTLSSSSSTCRYPHPTQCDKIKSTSLSSSARASLPTQQRYTMIVTSTGQPDKLRTLFNNIYSFLEYRSLYQIVVVLPHYTNTTLAADAKFGRRLLDWHAAVHHPVRIEWVETFWDVMVHDGRTVQWETPALLWMDGDAKGYSGNQRGIEAGFRLWRQHSDNLVASSGWELAFVGDETDADRSHSQNDNGGDGGGGDGSGATQVQEPKETTKAIESPISDNNNNNNNTNSVQQRRRLMNDATDNTTTTTTVAVANASATEPDEKIHSDGLLSFCKDDEVTMTRAVHQVHIPDLSGLFVHQNYLCFASHKKLQRLRDYSRGSFAESKIAFGLLLTQIAQTPPRLFPVKVVGQEQQEKLSGGDGNTEKVVGGPTDRGMSVSNRQQQQRRLQDSSSSQQEPFDSVSDSFVTHVLAYLGSMPSESISWCKDSLACTVQDTAVESSLPWMSNTWC